jgi:hypothetical protein
MKPICSKFLSTNKEFSITEQNLVNLYLQTSVLLCVTTTEFFKALLLYHLKGVSHKVSKFCLTMNHFAPTAWNKLRPYVDSDFRNTLAHGTWAVENRQVVLFNDAQLNLNEQLPLAEFMLKTKKQNVLLLCLINVLNERKKV